MDRLTFAAPGVSAAIDPAIGGRVAELVIDGLDVMAPMPAGGGLGWGCYPMVPWAGRVRHGRFTFDGEEHQLEVDLPPHAIHGLGYRTAWETDGPGSLVLDLTGRWAFGGLARQHFALTANELVATLSVTAGARPMPYLLGYHPCLRKRLDRGGLAELDFWPEAMWERDGEGIPTGALVAPPARPWDDCFAGVRRPPRLDWPGSGLALELVADTDAWVVYDEPTDIICVEPQTGAPDEFNRRPAVLEPGATARLDLTLRWLRRS